VDRDAQALGGLKAPSGGGSIVPLVADLAQPDAFERIPAVAVKELGRIDVLVNNAGIGMIARFEELPDLSVYEHLMKVNYLGCVYPTYHALPHLRASRGQIVVMASLAGLTGVPTRTGYAASKHALIGFCDSLRIELGGTGVDVTVVAPDFVVSEIHRRSLGAHGQPLGESPMQESKIMTTEECAAMIERAMEGRKRLVLGSLRGKFGRWARLVAPGVVDGIARRAVARGR
jgi:short-subunit dehydrogenase